MNKQYVLWVVHSDLSNPEEWPSMRHLYSKEKLELDKHFEQFRKKFQLSKGVRELHIEGIINAMKISQELGMPIVYENIPYGSKKFLLYITSKGINMKEVIFAHTNFKKILAELFEIRPNLKKEDIEFVLAGHYADACVRETARELKRHGFKSYLLIGTPTVRGTGVLRKELVKIYGKNRLITIHQLKHLK